MIDRNVELWAYEGGVRAYDLTAGHGYTHEWVEGPYSAELNLISDDGFTGKQLKQWFSSLFMYRFSAIAEGSEVWRGYITSMELKNRRGTSEWGIHRAKNIENLKNAIKVQYSRNDLSWYTVWLEDDDSIRDYGRREAILDYGGEVIDITENPALINGDATIADNTAYQRARAELAQYGNPGIHMAVPIRLKGDSPDVTLRLGMSGAMVLANNITLSDGSLPNSAREIAGGNHSDTALRYSGIYKDDGTDFALGEDSTVSVEIRRIIGVVEKSGKWLHAGSIAKNDTPTPAGSGSGIGAMARLIELAKLPDLFGRHYTLTVDLDGRVDYKLMSTVPAYSHTDDRGLTKVGSSLPPGWDSRPGPIKWWGESIGPQVGWLPPNMTLPKRVAIRDGQGGAEFHERAVDVGDVQRAIDANRQWVDSARKKREAK